LFRHKPKLHGRALLCQSFHAPKPFVAITVGIGISIWIKGFKNPDHEPKESGPEFLSKKIIPPKIFYLLCGSPKSKYHPYGVMTAWAFSMQLLGIGMLFHTLYYLLFAENQFDILINLIVIIIIVYGITFWFTIKKTYET